MKLISIVLKLLIFILDNLLKPIVKLGFRVYYYKLDHLKPLPKCQNPLLYLPAWKLAEKIRKKEVNMNYND